MIMNDDYFNLYLEKVRNINYLNEHLNDDHIVLTNEEFCSLFIIDKYNYNKPIMDEIDIVFIESMLELNNIELDRNNINKILDKISTKRINSELNRILVLKCYNYYNKTNYNKISIDNINKVLDSIS